MKPLRVSVVSDVHLGNKRNDTKFIISNLDKHFSCDEHLSTIDMVVIAGDFYDDLLSYPSIEGGLIDLWISKFLKKCHRYNILVRILEGTPSHDRQQSERFNIISKVHAEVSHCCPDLLYVKSLSIEHIDRFDIDVLYVPDEWSHDTNDTLDEVKSLLKSKNLTQVDIAIMHGLFEYQMGNVIKDNVKHNSKEYLAIVKGLIFIGHIHKRTNLDRIYAQGSFDRLAFGEEEEKGFLTAIINQDYSYEIKFIVNYSARVFMTIKCTSDDIEFNLKKIDKSVKNLRSESFIRVEAKYNNPIVNSSDTLKKRWPCLHWSFLPKETTDVDSTVVFSQDAIYEPIVINKETLLPLVMNRINKFSTDSDILNRCNLHLKDLT